jgi:hypothetical protein
LVSRAASDSAGPGIGCHPKQLPNRRLHVFLAGQGLGDAIDQVQATVGILLRAQRSLHELADVPGQNVWLFRIVNRGEFMAERREIAELTSHTRRDQGLVHTGLHPSTLPFEPEARRRIAAAHHAIPVR